MSRAVRVLLSGGLLVAAAGCTDEILDLQPTGEYTDGNVWSDLALVEQYVNTIYGSVPGQPGIGVKAGFEFVNCLGLSDEGFNTHNYCNSNAVNTGALSPSNVAWNPWTGNYSLIRRANIFMERIDDVPGDQARKDRLSAEVRFLRASLYAELAKTYGAVPLITTPFNLDDDFKVQRTPYEEIVAWVVTELDQAISALPLRNAGADLGRADGRAAMALKADVLLYAASPLHNPSRDLAKWQVASDAAKAVIDLGIHSLFTGDLSKLVLRDWHPEFIWARLYNPQHEDHIFFERNVASNGYGGWSAQTPSQQLVDAFEMANGLPITDPASGYDPNNPYEGRDPRFYATVVHDSTMFWGRLTEFWDGGRDSNKGIQPWNASLTGYTFAKWFDQERDLAAGRSGAHDKVWPIYRLAEMYLNYAEAQYHLGNEGEARHYVNLIRARPSVDLPPKTVGGTALLEAIKHERRVELAFEFKRFWDLLRWKDAEEVLSQPLMGAYISREAGTGVKRYEYRSVQPRTFHSHMYLFPIPNAEILRSNLEQNPGYN